MAIIIHVRSPVCAAISIKPTSCHGSRGRLKMWGEHLTLHPLVNHQFLPFKICINWKLIPCSETSKYQSIVYPCLSHYMSPQDTTVCGATHSHFQTPSVEKQNGGSWGRDFCFKTLTKYWYCIYNVLCWKGVQKLGFTTKITSPMHGQSGFSDIRVNKGYLSEIIPIRILTVTKPI